MKILVLGAGAIGSVFGGFLAQAGHSVCFVGRKMHMEAIVRDGLFIDGIWGKHCIRQNITATTSCLQAVCTRDAAYDLCLLTVKSYDTAAAVAMLAQSFDEPPSVLSLQNGLGNIEKLEARLGRNRTIGGRVIFGVEYKKPGSVTVTVAADKTYIGGLQGGVSEKYVTEIAELFTAAGIPTATTGDIQRCIWGKALYNCALNPLATILNVHYGMLLSGDASKRIMRAIVEEIFVLAGALKQQLDWSTAAAYTRVLFDELIPRTFNHHPSMLQDIHRGKKTEIDSLNGAMADLGKQRGIPMPCNWFMTQLVKAKEQTCRA